MFRLMTKILSLGIGLVFSLTALAADIPQVDIESQDFHQGQCVNDNYQNCLDSQCLTSDETDCNDQCMKDATAVCAQQADD